MKFQVLTVEELKRRMDRFIDDENRGISLKLFADLAGIDYSALKKMFQAKVMPITERSQVRVSKALWEVEQGRIVVMRRQNGSKYWAYRKEEKPRLTRRADLILTNEGIKLKLGVANRNDYSGNSLAEQLDKKHGR